MKNGLLTALCMVSLLYSYAQTFDVNGNYKISGNLGVGTPSPLGSLQITKVGTDAWVYFTNNLNGPSLPATSYGLSFGWNSSGAHGESIINYNRGVGTKPRLAFTSFNGTVIKEEMTIENGNVGIGTSSPLAKLDVSTNLPSQGNYDAQFWSVGNPDYHLRLQNVWNSHGITQRFIQKFAGVDYPLLSFYKGNVGIGTTGMPTSKLTVAGDIHSREVKVTIDAGADFVFYDDYDFRTLDEVEKFIQENKHLPDMASAREMEEGGLELGKMDMKLLQKVEELTLYLIDLKKEVDNMKEENQALKKELLKLKKN